MKINIKYCIFTTIIALAFLDIHAQNVATPDRVYGSLFTNVQMSRIFPDNKTFADATPKYNPDSIVKWYTNYKTNTGFLLDTFVKKNFTYRMANRDTYVSDKKEKIVTHIEKLWNDLTRQPDATVKGSSLIPLPYPYIVPGGRFQEVYYWDSYFTMLGLQESNRYDLIENIVKNFSYLIEHIGHIPNGNRTYFESRSQPPFYSLMLDLLAEKKGNIVYTTYLNALQKEYDYWSDKTDPTKHIVQLENNTILQRYWDQNETPREESFYEDSTLAIQAKHKQKLYRDLRSGAESGWDFSSRWFQDGKNIATIQTTNYIPVDLNCILYHLELTLAKSYHLNGNEKKSNQFKLAADKRKKAILKYCYNANDGWFYDYNLVENKLSTQKTIAGWFPYFFKIAPEKYFPKSLNVLKSNFVKKGGVVTTLNNTGQQWDAPNGWAPLQWITIQGLENYHEKSLAKLIAFRWANLNNKVYKETGKLMEKYNVEDVDLKAGGGEYPSQDGFGWTNGVLLKLIKKYNIEFK